MKKFSEKRMLLIVFVSLAMIFTGCTEKSYIDTDEKKQNIESREIQAEKELEKAFSYIKSDYDSTKDIRTDKMIDILAEHGYTVGMSDNSVNFRNGKELEQFCDTLHLGQDGNVCIYTISPLNYLMQYQITYADNHFEVILTGGAIESGELSKNMYYEEVQAKSWKYTESGWLFFEIEPAKVVDGENGYYAIKVTETDSEYRNLCQKYIAPIGYCNNNLFSVDWSESDLDELNMLDLFDAFYRLHTGSAPTNTEFTNGVPTDVFEGTIQLYDSFTVEQIRKKPRFDGETGLYWWRERNSNEYRIQDMPIPEVRGYSENGDGTITLTVAVVWKEMFTDYALVHYTTIRLLEDDGFQYVSNKVRIQESMEYPQYLERK